MPPKSVPLFITLAISLIAGVAAIIIPASQSSSLILLSLPFILLAPVPVLVAKQIAPDAGLFVGSWFVTSALIWPVFLAKLGWVGGWRAALWPVLGVLLLMSTAVVYNAVFSREDDDSAFL